MRIRFSASLLAALACAAAPLAAQDGFARTLLTVAATPDGIALSLDSASIARNHTGTFTLTAVYEYPPEMVSRNGYDHLLEPLTVDCSAPKLAHYGMVQAFRSGERLRTAARSGGPASGGDAEAPIAQAICSRLQASFAASLPMTYQCAEVSDLPELANPRDVVRALAAEYPGEFSESHVPGTVMLWIRVDAGGRVDPRSVTVLQASDPGFVDAALRVAPRMRFRPARVGGNAVAVWVAQPVAFQAR